MERMSEQTIKTQMGMTSKQLEKAVRQGHVTKHEDGSYSVNK